MQVHIDALRQTSGLCEKTNRIYIDFTSCNHSQAQVIGVQALCGFGHKR